MHGDIAIDVHVALGHLVAVSARAREPMTKKSVAKSVRKPIPPGLTPFKLGVRDPRQGRGPKKGAPNAGRPRSYVAEYAAQALKDPRIWENLRRIARQSKNPSAAVSAFTALSNRADGFPRQQLDIDDRRVLVVRSIEDYERELPPGE